MFVCNDLNHKSLSINLELTANEALNILQQSGFNIPEKWNRLAGIIGISISERKRLREEAQTTQDCHFALEQALDSWISNTPHSSWEGLLSAIEKCEADENVVSTLRKLLDDDDQQKLNVSSQLDSSHYSKLLYKHKTLSILVMYNDIICISVYSK